jgi:hypothetical protein
MSPQKAPGKTITYAIAVGRKCRKIQVHTDPAAPHCEKNPITMYPKKAVRTPAKNVLHTGINPTGNISPRR